jgi:hypothetical protein
VECGIIPSRNLSSSNKLVFLPQYFGKKSLCALGMGRVQFPPLRERINQLLGKMQQIAL